MSYINTLHHSVGDVVLCTSARLWHETPQHAAVHTVRYRAADLALCLRTILVLLVQSTDHKHFILQPGPTLHNAVHVMHAMQQHVFLWHAECGGGGGEHSRALAVLYYVSPDSGFTLDILQWTPGDTALCVKLRLQLHELADMHSFLLGCIVLDMCTIPAYPSGNCMAVTLVCILHNRRHLH